MIVIVKFCSVYPKGFKVKKSETVIHSAIRAVPKRIVKMKDVFEATDDNGFSTAYS